MFDSSIGGSYIQSMFNLIMSRLLRCLWKRYSIPVGSGPCLEIIFPRWALVTIISRLSQAKNARPTELHGLMTRPCIYMGFVGCVEGLVCMSITRRVVLSLFDTKLIL